MARATCYDIVIFGEPSVGKTCFVDQFCHGKSFVSYSPDASIIMHKIDVNGQSSNLTLIDLSTSFLKPENAAQYSKWAEKMLKQADGVVLLYDITSVKSFEYVVNQAYYFLWACRGPKETDGDERRSFGCVLAGNKLDLVTAKQEERAVDQTLAAEWAHTQGFRNIELDSLARTGPEQALKLLVKDTRKLERLGLVVAEEKQAGKSAGRQERISTIRNTIKDALRSSVG